MSKTRLKILWVDDDQLIRRIIPELITQLNADCDIVPSGEIAFEKLKTEDYDLLVTDITMPGMNGWELIEKMKSSLELQTKVVVTSGWNNIYNDEQIKQYEVNSVLTKPFKFAQIKKLIEGMTL